MATAREAQIIAAVARDIMTQDGYAFDQIFGRIALIKYLMIQDEKKLNKLRANKRVRKSDGGEYIEIPLEYAQGGTTTAISGMETLTFTQKEILTNAAYDWKYLFTTGVIDNKDILKCSGKAKKIASLTDTHVHNWMKTMATDLNTMLLKASASVGTNDFHSIPQLIQDDPTAAGTIGGINQASAVNSWWRNKLSDSAASTFLGLIKEITNLRNTIAGNMAGDKPNLALTDQEVYELIEAYYISKGTHTFQNSEMSNLLDAEVGRIKGMDLLWDESVPESTASTKGRMYLINTDYLQVTVHEKRSFELSDPIDMMVATQQDATGWTIALMGNLTMSNRSKHGVLFDIDKSITS